MFDMRVAHITSIKTNKTSLLPHSPPPAGSDRTRATASLPFFRVRDTMEGMAYVSENFWHDAVNKATTDLFTFGYKNIIKPNFVFNHTPDVAHDQMIQFCKITRTFRR